MSDQRRGIESTPIATFKGINRFTNITLVPPEYALDLLNVVCSNSGGLQKLRMPVQVSSAAVLGRCYGMWDYQRADGLRQIIGVFDTKIYKFTWDAGLGKYVAAQVDDNPLNAYQWSASESNNILFMANGKRMIKWTGEFIHLWGIRKPLNPAYVDPDQVMAINGFQRLNNIATFQVDDTSLLIDPNLYNTLRWTQDYTNAAWNKRGTCKITSNMILAPDGTLTGQLVEGIQASVIGDMYQNSNNLIASLRYEPSLYIRRISKAGLVYVNNPDNSVRGEWHVDLSLLSDDWERITRDHPAVTVVNEFQTSTTGVCGLHILSNNAGKLDFYLWGVQLESGTSYSAYRRVDAGSASDKVTIAGLADASFNVANTDVTTIIDGTHFSIANAGPDVAFAAGVGTATIKGVLSFATGRKYKYGFKSKVTGHESSASPATISTGVVANGIITLSVTDANDLALLDADPQIDTIVWYATIDGGVEYLLHSELPLSAGIPILNDRLLDADLDKTQRAPLVNDPPLIGKYVCEWGGRIYVGGIDGAPQDIIYSGVEQIRVGRPEEAFPPNNRLRLAIGADDIRGIGVVQAGIIAGSKSNELFMFRGEVEDVVTGEPIAYSAVLEKLPFNTAFASHNTISPTPYGLHFLTANRTIDSYDGTGKPYTLSLAVTREFQQMTYGAEEYSVGRFFNFLEKDWYIIGIPTRNNTEMNRILVFDLADSAEDSMGIFIFDIGAFDFFTMVESADGQPQLIIAQDGILKSLTVITDEINSIPQTVNVPDENSLLPAYWYGGYHGNATPQITKMWRKVHVVSTQRVSLHLQLVDDKKFRFANPKVINVPADKWDEEYSINWKSRRLSVGFDFPAEDVPVSILEMWAQQIPLSER